MRKYFSERSRLLTGIAILLFAILPGCEKDFDEIVDVNKVNYQVTGINTFTSFRYVVGDSVITISLSLNSSENVSKVFCDIIASDDSKLNSNPISLLDNGNPANGDSAADDDRFTALFPLSQSDPVGIYIIKYFVTDNNSNTKQVASHQFQYDNGQDNMAPVISNALIDPDTVVVIGTTVIQTTIHVTDDNGLTDIEEVYFIVYKPDGTTNNTKTTMFDDGNIQAYGDVTAGDGIFSRTIQVNQSNNKGTYRFEFKARDRGGLLSNSINYSVLIQ